MSPEPKLSKVERLAIGTAVAGPVRQQAKAPRKVTLVGKDGAPVGVTDSVEVAKSLLARSEIEFSVQDGKRPDVIVCRNCKVPFRRPPGKGGARACWCQQCKKKHSVCNRCGVPVKFKPRLRRSHGVLVPPRCRECMVADMRDSGHYEKLHSDARRRGSERRAASRAVLKKEATCIVCQSQLKVRKSRGENAGRKCHACAMAALHPPRLCECGNKLRKGPASSCWGCHVKRRRVRAAAKTTPVPAA